MGIGSITLCKFRKAERLPIGTHNELNMKAGPWLAFVAFALLACGKRDNVEQRREGMVVAEPMATNGMVVAKDMAPLANQSFVAADAISPAVAGSPPDTKVIAASDSATPGMIIRTGQASIEIDKLDPALAKLRQLAAQLGGYVANSSFSGGRDQVRSATLELKIPAARYDQLTTGLNVIGKLESINTTADDVGEEYVDINARVANAHRLEERLVNLLATRTGKLEDVLAVERELARVREEVERYEGRMRFLRTRSAISTLTVTIHEPVPILGKTPGENPVEAAVRQAWRNFVGLIAAFIASLGVLVPVGLVGSVAWYFYRRARLHRAA